MKRLVYAAAAFVLMLSLTVYSHIAVDRYCEDTVSDIKNFSSQKMSAEALTRSWSERKEKMSAFVNHDFLDQISLYIGQMTLGDSKEDEGFAVAYKNVETLLKMIKDEQRLAPHSFY